MTATLSPSAVARMAPPARLFRQREITESGCWEWTGYRNPFGYGRVKIARRFVRTHRVAYEELVGPIPEGHEIDHLCGNPPCFNPDHLDPVTPEENKRRAAERITHCRRGHPFDEANTYRPPGNPTRRSCRICMARYQAGRKDKRAAEAAA